MFLKYRKVNLKNNIVLLLIILLIFSIFRLILKNDRSQSPDGEYFCKITFADQGTILGEKVHILTPGNLLFRLFGYFYGNALD